MMRTNDDFCQNKSEQKIEKIISKVIDNKDLILCDHCKRTASNGIRCMGICVADNDY